MIIHLSSQVTWRSLPLLPVDHHANHGPYCVGVVVMRVFFGALQEPGLGTGNACGSCDSSKCGISRYGKRDNDQTELSVPSWPVVSLPHHDLEPARFSPGLNLIFEGRPCTVVILRIQVPWRWMVISTCPKPSHFPHITLTSLRPTWTLQSVHTPSSHQVGACRKSRESLQTHITGSVGSAGKRRSSGLEVFSA